MIKNEVFLLNKDKERIYYIKIGVSVNPKKRLFELQTGCPFKLHIISSFDLRSISKSSFEIEKALHKILKPFSTYGEWFEISAYQIPSFIKYIESSIDFINKDLLVPSFTDNKKTLTKKNFTT